MTPGSVVSSLDAEDFQRLERALVAFVQRSAAAGAMLIDRSGRMLVSAGQMSRLDEVAFASLAAADFAAGDQLAALLGEKDFESLYHQGEELSMYLADVDTAAILAALFDRRTTLGLVRYAAREAVSELASVLTTSSGSQRSGAALEAGWFADAEQEIDRLFRG